MKWRGMNMRRVLEVFAFSGALGLMLGGFSTLSYGANAEFTLRYAGDMVIGNHLTRAQEFFAKRVDELSKGRIKIEVYPAGQLFATKDFVKVVPSGACDMALSLAASWSGRVPAASLLDLPLFYEDIPHFWRVLESEAGEVIKKEMERINVKPINWLEDAVCGFTTKSPLKTLNDFKGKRIRAVSEFTSQMIKFLGGAPTYMGGGEVYMALQRGTVDGAMTSQTSLRDRKYYEVTKYVTEPGVFYSGYIVNINLQKWNSLPDEIQKILLTAGKDTTEFGKKEVRKEEVKALEEIVSKGMEVYYLPKQEKDVWKKICNKPMENVFLAKVGDSLGRQLLSLVEKVR